MHIDLEAREPTWISITEVDGNSLMARVLEPNETRSFELTKGATLRTGNAGALTIRLTARILDRWARTERFGTSNSKTARYKIRPPNPAIGEAAEASSEKIGRAVIHHVELTNQIS